MQRFTWDKVDEFVGVEKMLQENSFPRLFFRKTKTLSPIVGSQSKITVNKYGLGLLNLLTPEK